MPTEALITLRARLTGRGIATLVVGVLALVLGLVWRYPGLVALGVGLAGLTVLAVVSVLLPAPVVPSRLVAPLRVPRYGRCTATLRIRSAGQRFAIRLDAAERIGERHVPIVVPRLLPGRSVETSYVIPTERRGVVEVGPLRLRRVGTAGLAVAEALVGGTVTVHVLPRVLRVLGLPSGAKRGHVGADERVERGGTDLVALREYVPGDDLRRVHWATSARTTSLMVREDADPARPYLSVLVDDRAESYEGDQLEDAVEVAASLVTQAIDGGHPVQLSTVSGSIDVEIPAAVVGMLAPGADEALRRLAELAPAAAVEDAASIPVRDLDVVAVVTGSQAALPPLVGEAGRAAVGVALVVDARHRTVDAHGSVLVLRAPRAEDCLTLWDEMVAR